MNVIHTTKKYSVAKDHADRVFVKFAEMKSGSFNWVAVPDLKDVYHCRPKWQQKIIDIVDSNF